MTKFSCLAYRDRLLFIPMRLQEIKTKPDEDMCMLAKGAKTKLNKIKDIGTTFIVKDVYKCF